MQAGGTVDSFLGTENAMADEGVADLEQSLALGAVLRQPCQVGSNQLLQLLQLVLTHVAADVLGRTVHRPDHLYVHVGSPGPEETSIVRVDELFALLAFEEVEASFVAHVRISLQMGWRRRASLGSQSSSVSARPCDTWQSGCVSAVSVHRLRRAVERDR